MIRVRINLTTCAPAALISHRPTGREPQSFITRSRESLASFRTLMSIAPRGSSTPLIDDHHYQAHRCITSHRRTRHRMTQGLADTA
jgi:hypothetical protein